MMIIFLGTSAEKRDDDRSLSWGEKSQLHNEIGPPTTNPPPQNESKDGFVFNVMGAISIDTSVCYFRNDFLPLSLRARILFPAAGLLNDFPSTARNRIKRGKKGGECRFCASLIAIKKENPIEEKFKLDFLSLPLPPRVLKSQGTIFTFISHVATFLSFLLFASGTKTTTTVASIFSHARDRRRP